MDTSALTILLALAVVVGGLAVVSWRAIAGRKGRREADSQDENDQGQNVSAKSSPLVPPPEIAPPPMGEPTPGGSDIRIVGEKPTNELPVKDRETESSISAFEKQSQMETQRTVLTAPPASLPGESAEKAGDTESKGGVDQTGAGQKGPPRSDAEDGSAGRDSLETQKRRPLDPAKRVGRARGTDPRGTGQESRKRGLRIPKPEIVCWKKEQEWILAVEFPETIQRASDLLVLQNGVSLLEDEYEQGCWHLGSLVGEISARDGDSGTPAMPNLSLGDSGYQLFKLAGGELRLGRRVKHVSRGSYLVVVPASWERDEQQAGPAPATPEPVCLDGYRAHFFDLISDPSPRIAFRDSSGHPVLIGLPGQQFQLVGHELRDASETQGPLFVSEPPRICIHTSNWENVRTIVLGEEGHEHGKWRTCFAPTPHRADQDMPADFVERKAGWYFLRFYDHQDELLDSMDFRFAAGLQEMRSWHNSPLPPKTGHEPTTVEFHHEADWHIRPSNAQDIKVEHGSGRTILHIPATPQCDRSEWIVGPQKGPQVNVVILVERVWWQVGTERQIPSKWKDICLTVSGEAFTATSKEAIWLRFPKSRWAERVFVGFCMEMRRRYEVRVDESLLAIPLRDLCDSKELRNPVEDQFLRVWTEVNRTVYESAVLMIRAEALTGKLEIRHVSPSRVASVLTKLCHSTRGPLRRLFKKVRHLYRRQRRSAVGANDEFVKCALCAIAVFHQLTADGRLFVPRSARRWKARAERAGKQFPETMHKVWKMYSRLGRRTRDHRT